MTAQERVAVAMMTQQEPERLSLLPHPYGTLKSEGRVGRGSVMNAPIDWTNWIAPEAVASLGRAASLPMETYQGQPVTPQAVNEMGVAAMGGGMTIGSAPRGALGMFAGVRSQKADMAQLLLAKELQSKGMSGKNVFYRTGWFEDIDKNWKHEIDDSQAALTETVPSQQYSFLKEPTYSIPLFEGGFFDKTKPLGQGEVRNRTMADTLRHDAAYQAYPDIATKPVRSVGFNFDVSGAFDPTDSSFALGRGTKNEMEKTALHEMQHAIQAREGWASGGNSSQFLPESFSDDKKAIRKAIEAIEEKYVKRDGISDFSSYNTRRGIALRNGPAPKYVYESDKRALKAVEDLEQLPEGKEYIRLQQQLYEMGDMQKVASEKYRTLAGEALARLVEKRKDYAPMQRRDIYPPSDYDQLLKDMHGYGPEDLKPPKTYE